MITTVIKIRLKVNNLTLIIGHSHNNSNNKRNSINNVIINIIMDNSSNKTAARWHRKPHTIKDRQRITSMAHMIWSRTITMVTTIRK